MIPNSISKMVKDILHIDDVINVGQLWTFSLNKKSKLMLFPVSPHQTLIGLVIYCSSNGDIL